MSCGSEQVEQIPPSVNDANDFDTVIKDAIENHVIADDQISQSKPDVISRRPEVRMVQQPKTALVDAIEHSVSSLRVIGGDVVPDVDQILTCPAGAKQPAPLAHPPL